MENVGEFDGTGILRTGGRRMQRTGSACQTRDKAAPGESPETDRYHDGAKTEARTNLSSGTPRPIIDWKDVAAGLLALGSSHFTCLPGRIQWLKVNNPGKVLADNSCGGSPGFQIFRSVTGFPFNPLEGEPSTGASLVAQND